MRNFGINSRPDAEGAFSHPAGLADAVTRYNSRIQNFAQFLPPEPAHPASANSPGFGREPSIHELARPLLPGWSGRSLSDARNERASFPPASSPFERGKFAQALLDIAALFVAFLLISATGIAIAGSLFILFCVAL